MSSKSKAIFEVDQTTTLEGFRKRLVEKNFWATSTLSRLEFRILRTPSIDSINDATIIKRKDSILEAGTWVAVRSIPSVRRRAPLAA